MDTEGDFPSEDGKTASKNLLVWAFQYLFFIFPLKESAQFKKPARPLQKVQYIHEFLTKLKNTLCWFLMDGNMLLKYAENTAFLFLCFLREGQQPKLWWPRNEEFRQPDEFHLVFYCDPYKQFKLGL